MVEVTIHNFRTLLPTIRQLIQASCFVCVDTEFTGLAIDDNNTFNLFDTTERRFQKLKSLADNFLICQIGLSAFVKDQMTNSYTAHSYNFYLFPSVCGSLDRRFSMQASNTEFLKKHNFDFNKFIYDGIPYLNNDQEKMYGHSVDDLGFTLVFRDLVKSKKPLLGHNMLVDLCLIYKNFHQHLPATYEEFKCNIHQMFPTIIDTKQLSFQLKRPLESYNLLDFNALPELYEAFTSRKGKSVVLFMPNVLHADDCMKYKSSGSKYFHEASFDAYCVGYVFLRMAHLVAMNGVRSSEARPVHFSNYLKLLEHFVNKVNVIRGPVHYIDFGGDDPVASRPQWIVATTKDRSPLNIDTLTKQMDEHVSMDVQRISAHKLIVAVSSHKKADELMEKLYTHDVLHGRYYSWLRDSSTGQEMIWRIILLTGSAGIICTSTLLWWWDIL